jgi:hypothetical protein
VAPWAAGVYSIVRFELAPAGAGTRLVFDHTGFPPEDREDLNANWYRAYWNPLQAYLAR